MFRYQEVWLVVDDFDVIHYKEEWEIVQDVVFSCTNCGIMFTSNGSLQFHWRTSHEPTGYDFLRFVNEWFSIPS